MVERLGGVEGAFGEVFVLAWGTGLWLTLLEVGSPSFRTGWPPGSGSTELVAGILPIRLALTSGFKMTLESAAVDGILDIAGSEAGFMYSLKVGLLVTGWPTIVDGDGGTLMVFCWLGPIGSVKL